MLGIFLDFEDLKEEEKEEINSHILKVVNFYDLIMLRETLLISKDFSSSILNMEKILQQLKKCDLLIDKLRTSYVLDIVDYCPLGTRLKSKS